MVPKPTAVKASSLVMDFDLYPREQVQSFHVKEITLALQAGVVLPPVVADRKSRRIIDGFHRVRANLRLYGPDAEIMAIMKTYESDAEMYIEAMTLNASHGAKLSPYDRARCIAKSEELGIELTVVATALNTTLDRVTSIRVEKFAIYHDEPRALKRTAAHLAGTRLTDVQDNYVAKSGGMHQLFYVNQVTAMLEADTVDWENDKLVRGLRKMHDWLDKVLEPVST